MGKVTADMSMSLDGFITGPDPGPDSPLGADGERLHQWLYELSSWREQHGLAGGETSRDAEIMAEAFAGVGAVVMGKGMFRCGERPWGENPPFHVPVFVLTHESRAPLIKEGGTSFIFVTDGIKSALAQAKSAAGDEDVSVAGGANVIQQAIRAGLLDEIQIHVVPVLLGAGVRLFDDLGAAHVELERTRVVDSPQVTHLRYRFIK